MANGVWSSAPETARGGARSRAFRVGAPLTSGGSSHNMSFERRYSEEELWENYTYFIQRIVPVAEETGVKIGIHPDDPPGLTLGNVPRPVFSSFEGYRRALEIANSPNVGMGLCTGCWLEGGPAMGRNVFETIEYFGGLKKLFIVHFRNVHQPLWAMPQSPGTPGGISFSLSRAVVDSGPDKLKLIPHGAQRLPETEALPLPYFRETFLNEGYMHMYKIMRQLRKVNFDGVLIADHWPNMLGGPRAGQIYSIAYIQALIERANEEVSA